MYGVPRMMTFVSRGIASGLRPAVLIKAVLLQDVFDLYLPVLDGPLQGLVGKGVPQHVEGVDDEVAPVCPVHGAGADHGEVRERHAVDYLVLYPSEKVEIGRIALEDDGRAFCIGVVDDHVDGESGE